MKEKTVDSAVYREHLSEFIFLPSLGEVLNVDAVDILFFCIIPLVLVVEWDCNQILVSFYVMSSNGCLDRVGFLECHISKAKGSVVFFKYRLCREDSSIFRENIIQVL